MMTRIPDDAPRNLAKSSEADHPLDNVNIGSETAEQNNCSARPLEMPLWALGIQQAEGWVVESPRKRSKVLKERWRQAARPIEKASQRLAEAALKKEDFTEDERWIVENARFLRGNVKEVGQAVKSTRNLPYVRLASGPAEAVPRAYRMAKGYLEAAHFAVDEKTLGEYLTGVERATALKMSELWALRAQLQLVLLGRLAEATQALQDTPEESSEREQPLPEIPPGSVATAVHSLHEISQMEWKEFFEANSIVHHILGEDPSGAYPKMDFESRQIYRDALEDLALDAKWNEAEIAKQAVLFAQNARSRQRGISLQAAERRSSVGYYLLDDGIPLLKHRIGYRPPLKKKIKDLILEWPEVYYVVGVELTTLLLVYAFLRHLGPLIPLIPGLLLLIPASQAAVGLMNCLTSWLLLPRRIPKLDFAEGIPKEFSTLVVVPSMLLNEKEVRHIAEALEVRYLGNRDPNLHFALLTDAPDASQPTNQHDELVALCSSLIDGLNSKYGGEEQGSFFHFHRERVYNPQEKTWMGWERKRGKLLDLNRLLRNRGDSFPVKVGDLSVLPKIRYVITLDSDTRLPRDSAHRMVGAMAHPLNRAVIDRETNTVVEGYGILQPRVGIGIESARKSRLGSIYSGETGYDIYTRAVSDVYQDLFGEGSFTGKGIYEVDAFQQVLGNRFPSNALLSHDLIEGAYARAGLLSDAEVIDDYPSHFSAYCRRMHRWVRGDWQILRWLFNRVPDFFGRQVANPLTWLSRWKMFDNLRRSLFELDLFVLLLAGWFFFPGGALYWTLLTLVLILAPTYVQLFFALLGIKSAQSRKGFLKKLANDFFTGHLQVFVMLVFLAHRALVMLDAIVRTLARLTITHKNLLEWETAAEAEIGTRKKTPVEVYLTLTPWLALGTAATLAAFRPAALPPAAPVLGLWTLAGVFTKWINRPPRRRQYQLSPQETNFLRLAALNTWRYFREFSDEKTHWLVPDRVQEMPPAVVRNLSPTNLGLLLNARVAAHHFGYLTLAEFAEQTEKTLRSAKRLPRFKGHFFNWYDIDSGEPLPPHFVSTVDSGNLAACFWTLKQACLGLANEPLFAAASWRGIRDHASLLTEISREKIPPPEVVSAMQRLADSTEGLGEDPTEWLRGLPRLRHEARELVAALRGAETGAAAATDELAWWAAETLTRIERLIGTAQAFTPWLLRDDLNLQVSTPLEQLTLNALPSLITELEKQLENLPSANAGDAEMAGPKFSRSELEACGRRAAELAGKLEFLAKEADEFLQTMDFRFLYNSKRKLLSIGYDVTAQRQERSCYNLVASEARIASFIAVAKGDISQEAWFRLGRSRTVEQGETVLVSWTGTMFEYLMPLLWMRSYPGTMLDKNVRSAVVCQQKYAKKNGVPWGISEAAFNLLDQASIYQYRAFGLPGLAASPSASDDLIIAPYASFLALMVDPAAAIKNLRAMRGMGWSGRWGFYESADYTTGQTPGDGSYELVRCWMVHHQGMSLLAVCNLLTRSSLEHWFHQETQVMATELLLHEKVPFTTPEEARTTPRPRRKSRQASAAKSNERSPAPAEARVSEKRPQAAERAVKISSDANLGQQPTLNEEAAPPQI